jgi:2-dehydropantoate 2-reductase
MRRYGVVGVGAVGGAIAGALVRAGCEVVLVARGAHGAAIAQRGLALVTPASTETIRARVVTSVDAIGACEAIVIATKSQDTATALASVRDRSTPIACAQNGVVNERIASTHAERVIGMVVFAPLSHVEPGIVSVHAAPRFGGIDLGLWPSGEHAIANELARDLDAAFDVRVRDDIARWKYGKLLTNLANVLDAVGGRAALRPEWIRAVNDEAEACLRAAGIPFVSATEVHERFADVRELTPRGGGSTWQSLARARPLETEHLNGEIVALGRAHGIATPWNEALVSIGRSATSEGWTAGSRTIDGLTERLPRLRAP